MNGVQKAQLKDSSIGFLMICNSCLYQQCLHWDSTKLKFINVFVTDKVNVHTSSLRTAYAFLYVYVVSENG